MSIQTYLTELDNLNIEINRINKNLYEFRKRRKIIEDKIIEFLKNQETHGVKFNDKAILLQTKNGRQRKKKDDKLNDIQNVLKKYDIRVNNSLVNDIIESQRGATVSNESLKIVNSKKNIL